MIRDAIQGISFPMGYVFFFLMAAFGALLIPFSDRAFEGASEGLRTFTYQVAPSLFPFTVCACFFTRSGKADPGKLRPALRYPAAAFFSAVCGTPSAAMICGMVCPGDAGMASALCAVCNQAGPMFIVSTLSSAFFGDRSLALPLALSHYLPAFSGSLILCAFGARRGSHDEKLSSPPPPSSASAFTGAISEAVTAMLRVCGTIVFFRTAQAVAEPLLLPGAPAIIKGAAAGAFEMTNGLRLVSLAGNTRNALTLASFILSFGGICLFAQSKLIYTELRAGPYFAAKAATGALSALTFWLLYPRFYRTAAVFGFTGERTADLLRGSAEAGAAAAGFALSAALCLLCSFTASRLFKKS